MSFEATDTHDPLSSPQTSSSSPPTSHDNGGISDDVEVDSLPSITTEDTLDEHGESDAEREWRESLQQVELILTMVLVPYIGKYFGRKFAYWGWARFMEWKYPVEVVMTSPRSFKASGAVKAAVL